MTHSEHTLKAGELMSKGQKGKAASVLRSAARQGDTGAAHMLASMLYDDGEDGEAVDILRAALEGGGADPSPEAGECELLLGTILFEGYEARGGFRKGDPAAAAPHVLRALRTHGLEAARTLAGRLVLAGAIPVDGDPPQEAMRIWREGMEAGEAGCTLRYCAALAATTGLPEDLRTLMEEWASEGGDSCGDAAAVLYMQALHDEDQEAEAEWYDLAIDNDSGLLVEMCSEEEVGEDSWTAPDPSLMWVATVQPTNTAVLTGVDDASLGRLLGSEAPQDLRCALFGAVARDLGLSSVIVGWFDPGGEGRGLPRNYMALKWAGAAVHGNLLLTLVGPDGKPEGFPDQKTAIAALQALSDNG